jgi:hypothetical protein
VHAVPRQATSIAIFLVGCLVLGCGAEKGAPADAGGTGATGGVATGGAGGVAGRSGTGGAGGAAAGRDGGAAGQAADGGRAGGAAGTGGISGTGGNGGQAGGSAGAGGIPATGGAVGTGGRTNGAGGSAGSGTGGRAGAGGTSAGGTVGTGGRGPGGGAGGAAASGGAGGTASATYTGCSFVGGIDRVAVAKRDGARNLCAVIVFSGGTNTSEVTLRAGWRVEHAFVGAGTAAGCARRFPPADAAQASRVTGTATWTAAASWPYGTANVDVVLHFGPDAGTATDEPMRATNVDVAQPCE